MKSKLIFFRGIFQAEAECIPVQRRFSELLPGHQTDEGV
jgi:hypothetical protein